MPPIITDADDRARIVRLHEAVDAAREAVATAMDIAAAAAAKVSQLKRALADHDAAKPTDDPALADELSELLAANPTAAASADWTGRLLESQGKQADALAAWQGKRTIILQALDKVEAERRPKVEAVTEAKAAHEQAWSAFVNASRPVMFAELERQFPAFYNAVLGPIEALSNARQIYSFQSVLLTGRSPYLTPESTLSVHLNPPPEKMHIGGIPTYLNLFPSKSNTDFAPVMAAFRERLREPEPVKSEKRS